METNFDIEKMRSALFRFIERNLSLLDMTGTKAIRNPLSEARSLASDFPVRFGYLMLAREYERIGMKLLEREFGTQSKIDSVLPVTPQFEWHSLRNHFYMRTFKAFETGSLEKMAIELEKSKSRKMERRVRQLYDIERLRISMRLKRFDVALGILQEIISSSGLKRDSENEIEIVVHDYLFLEEMIKHLCGARNCRSKKLLAHLLDLFFKNIKQVPSAYICDVAGNWRPLYCLELITETWYSFFEVEISFEPDLWIQSPLYGYLKTPIISALPDQYDKLLH